MQMHDDHGYERYRPPRNKHDCGFEAHSRIKDGRSAHELLLNLNWKTAAGYSSVMPDNVTPHRQGSTLLTPVTSLSRPTASVAVTPTKETIIKAMRSEEHTSELQS